MNTLKTAFFAFATLFSLSNCTAQWGNKVKGNGDYTSITRSVSDYDQISLAGSMDFILVKGKEGTIELSGESNILDYIITETKGDKLIVKFKNNINISYKSKPIKITIPFEDINYVSLAGSGDVINKSIIKTDDFTAKVSGSGDMNLNIDSDNTEAKVTGSGDLTLNGNANSLKASVTGSGDFHGEKLSSNDAEVKITGSGTIDLMVKNNLNARVTGSGDINYSGNPKNVDKKVIGSGDITKK